MASFVDIGRLERVAARLAVLARGDACAREMSREFMFENEFAICWKTTIPPNMPLKMHRHDRGRTIVALQGGVLTRVDEDGTTKDLVFDTGKAYWYEADPPNNLHADVNQGERDVVVVVTEFKTERMTIGLPFKLPEGWEPPTTKRDG